MAEPKKPATEGAKATETLEEAKLPKKTAATRKRRLNPELAKEKIGGGVAGFVNFIREKGVVGLAIGLAIGTAASGLVTQIVNAVITPTVSLMLGLFGQENLRALNVVVKRAADGSPLITYGFGDLIDALIKFMAIAAVIYFVVLGLKLDKLDKPKDAK